MLLTITTTYSPATDLGYLLHKHPARAQTFDLSFGQAHVFYPEATAERCTVALLLDIDPIGLVRNANRSGGSRFALEQYVNDRPYVASSFLSVAIAQVFSSALNGHSHDRAELVETVLPLYAEIAVLPCRGGESVVRRLFEPLGYTLEAQRYPLDEHFPEWGDSPYYTLHLQHTLRLRDLLAHLYVLLPVLDDDKHYWVGDDEVAKLLRFGEGWLGAHPDREFISHRYLKHQHHLTRAALVQLTDEDDPDPDETEARHEAEEQSAEAKLSLHQQRLQIVLEALRESGAARVLDLGCGEGKLLRLLLGDKQFTEILALDVAYRSLEIATERLHLDRLAEKQRQRLQLIHGSLTYRDQRLAGYDAAAVVEVIEHLDPPRLSAFERVLFEFTRPRTIVITTPNREYNALWPDLPAYQMRHRDHRFEWTRDEFQTWAQRVAEQHGYTVRFAPVGPADPDRGAPTQMGVFTR